MKIHATTLGLGALAWVAIGCGSASDMKSQDSQPQASTTLSQPAPSASTTKQASIQRTNSQMIYTGQIDEITNDLDASSSKLDALVNSVGGYYSEAHREGLKGSDRTANWKVRVPSTHYFEFVRDVEKIGNVKSSTQTSEDVSVDFVDAQAKLRDKRIEEQRIVELLRKRRDHLQDVITVENELARVRAEGVTAEAKVKQMDEHIGLSTVTITMIEPAHMAPVVPPTFGSEAFTTLKGSTETALVVVRLVALSAIALTPWVALFGVAGLAINRAYKSLLARRG